MDEYQRRLEARRAEAERFDRIGDRIGNARFAVAAGAAVLLWAATGSPGWASEWLLVPAVLFVGLMVHHERVIRARDRARRAERYWEGGIRRLMDEWPGRGNAGERYRDSEHPCASDLDLFGEGSVFERLCVARTRSGEDTLAAWLRDPAPAEVIPLRQAAVREIAPRLDLREEIALLGEDASVSISAETLDAWGGAPPAGLPRWLPPVAWPLGVAGLATLGTWLAGVTGPGPLAAAILLELALLAPYRKKISSVLSFADRPAGELALLGRILGRIEAEEFSAALLVGLAGRLETAGEPPSVRIRRLVRLQNFVDSLRNAVFAPFALLALLPVQTAAAIERWRAASGGAAGDWLRAAGEVEALLSLAAYAFERPEDAWPEVVAEDGPLVAAEAATHPLLPESRAVRNDLTLGRGLQLLVVSGSNMSGKSTLMRTVGVNVVLALAGAPVCARSLCVTPLRVAASMRVDDSLLEGASRFYAEITRLKRIVDLAAGEPPVLFLLDELLGGTNSHDRAAGAEGLVTGLLDRGAIGIVTTHDLALGQIAESLAPRAKNVHFEDRMEDDRMVFDYRLRPGVVTRSNALDLMRAIGLDV